MTNTIRECLETLASLQLVDSNEQVIDQHLAGVEQRIAALETELEDFKRKVAEGEQRLEDLHKTYRANEEEIRSIEDRVARNDEKLRSVKTNKEYQSMLREIDDLKMRKAAIEEQMIDMLEQLEGTEKEVVSHKADLADMQQEIQARQAEIEGEAKTQRAEKERLAGKRDSIWARLDARMQKVYTRAKQQGRGVAVAAVDNEVCQVCRMNLPPQRFIELMRMDAMQMCPHCQRIIYPKAMIDDDV